MRAIVTGAGRGMGLAWAEALRAGGHEVIGTARKPVAAGELAATGATVVPLDVTDPAGIEAFAAAVASTWDGVDLLVHNAGINSKVFPDARKNLRLGSLEASGMLAMAEVNAVGPALVTQALVELLAAGDQPKVAFVSSWLGSIAGKQSGGNHGYCASKAMLNMIARTLSFDLAKRGITGLVLNPGWVRTDMGGAKAPLSAEESVAGMLGVVERAGPEHNGRFFDHTGDEHPW